MCLTEGSLSIFLPSNFPLSPSLFLMEQTEIKEKHHICRLLWRFVCGCGVFWLFGNRTCPISAIRLLSGKAFGIKEVAEDELTPNYGNEQVSGEVVLRSRRNGFCIN